MRSFARLALPAAFAALVAAAGNVTTSTNGTTVNLLIPDADRQSLVASVVATSADLTTFVVACPTGTPSQNCGYPKPFTLTEGASTVAFSYEIAEDKYTMAMNCAIAGTTSATCTAIQTGGNMPGTQTYIVKPTYLPVAVTAGQALLAVSTTAPASLGASGAAAASGMPSATSTGAAAKMTGGVFGGLSGVVAAAAFAAVI